MVSNVNTDKKDLSEKVSQLSVLDNKEQAMLEVSENVSKTFDMISQLSVHELIQLTGLYEKVYGISPMAQPVVQQGSDPDSGTSSDNEKSEFNVTIDSFEGKMPVVKYLRSQGLTIGEASAMLKELPCLFKESVKKDEAEEIKSSLEAVGAKVSLS